MLKILNIDFWGKNEIVDGGMRITWIDEGHMFGNVDFYKENNKIYVDTEQMGENFLNCLLLELNKIVNIVD